ncbi:MAG: patatin-like phospholipase family protein [Syntrophobacteraceae bacterium]|jgi:hypothetical protein
MSGNLVFYAGTKAMHTISRNGLSPGMVKVILGAAGGPKWLVLHGLDRAIFTTWITNRTEPLFLLGSSIGAWRFAAVTQSDPSEALDRFLSAYIAQRYTPYPGREEITLECAKMLGTLLGSSGIKEILHHPFLRLGVFTAHCKWPVASDNKVLLALGLLDAAIYNTVHRAGLRFFFDRVLFFAPGNPPPLGATSDVETRKIPLSPRNLKDVLLASGSVPLLMLGVDNIPDAPRGMYRDGGIIDYHFDLPILQDDENDDGLILFPHYTDRIVPGWFDKGLPWRKPREANVDRLLLVSPSKQFIERLPYKRIPNREDFPFFRGRDEERVAYWNEVIEASASLGEEFLEAVETGAVRELAKPIADLMR